MAVLTKFVFGLAVMLVIPNSAFALDNADLIKANKDVLNEFAMVCKGDAAEDEVEPDALADYLMMCINDELESNGFKALTAEELQKLIKPLLKD